MGNQAGLLQNAVILGLSAGICEETARLIGFAALKARARSWQAALTLGIGHDGTESAIIGELELITFINMLVLRNADPASR